jgi:hypothetical protein
MIFIPPPNVLNQLYTELILTPFQNNYHILPRCSAQVPDDAQTWHTLLTWRVRAGRQCKRRGYRSWPNVSRGSHDGLFRSKQRPRPRKPNPEHGSASQSLAADVAYAHDPHRLSIGHRYRLTILLGPLRRQCTMLLAQ